jgi:hypothetical protein
MKKIIIGILIGIGLSVGSISIASSGILLVRIPEYIKGYKTTELLEYVADLKKESDLSNIAQTPVVETVNYRSFGKLIVPMTVR